MLSRDFKRLFIRRELEVIRGFRNRNTVILLAILFGTFFAIAISKGGLEYLGLKMNDPFVENLEIDIPYSKAMLVEDYKLQLNADSLKDLFRYDTVMAHVEYPLLFWNSKRDDFRRIKGRSIEPGNPLLEQITGRKNLIRGRTFRDQYDCGLIVTSKMLNDFGYPDDALFLEMGVRKTSVGYYRVPVPIIAIVKELPGLCSFAFTPYFFKVRNTGLNNAYNISDYRDINLFYPGIKPEIIHEIRKVLEKIVHSIPELALMDPLVEVFKDQSSYSEGNVFNITFYPEPASLEETERIYELIMSQPELQPFQGELYRYYLYDFPGFPELQIFYDKISVVFNSLSRIHDFKDYLYNVYELEVEMSKVRDKENFTAISILTYTMSFILLIFSIISVSFFIYNLLRSHLEKIKMNLGTFQAFGMSNRSLMVIYRLIIHRFVLHCMLAAYAGALILNLVLVSVLFRELSPLQLINFEVLIAILIIWVMVELVYRKTAQSILLNTPGDLIYGRK